MSLFICVTDIELHLHYDAVYYMYECILNIGQWLCMQCCKCSSCGSERGRGNTAQWRHEVTAFNILVYMYTMDTERLIFAYTYSTLLYKRDSMQ